MSLKQTAFSVPNRNHGTGSSGTSSGQHSFTARVCLSDKTQCCVGSLNSDSQDYTASTLKPQGISPKPHFWSCLCGSFQFDPEGSDQINGFTLDGPLGGINGRSLGQEEVSPATPTPGHFLYSLSLFPNSPFLPRQEGPIPFKLLLAKINSDSLYLVLRYFVHSNGRST